MDKNNDNIQVNKEDKWNKYIANLSLWQVKNRVDELVNSYGPKLSIEIIDAINGIYKSLDEALDTFNELEDKYKTKEDVLGKMIKEVAELEKEKIDLEVRLAQSDDLRYRSAKYAWAIKTILKRATFSPGHVAEELRFMARKSTTPKDVQERWEGYADEFLGEHSKLVEGINGLKKKNEELEKLYDKVQDDRLKEAVNVSKKSHENELLKEDINILKEEKSMLASKNKALGMELYERNKQIHELKKKIYTYETDDNGYYHESYVDTLKKENDELKKENNNLTTDAKRLSDAVNTWFDMFNDMRHKCDDLKKELNDKNKLICKLTPKKSNSGSNKVPPIGCCGCCTICTLKDICWILND